MGRTPAELEHALTAGELAEFQALVEIDGPWWGEREAAHLQQLASIVAATTGANIPPDEFQIGWELGAGGGRGGVNLLPSNDGIEIFAARYGLAVEREQ